MTREKIDIKMNGMELIKLMSEGNPGGMSVLADMIQDGHMLHILGLDDMNIRGSQIWVGFKDHCGEDLDVFVKAIKDRDPEMVATINRECHHPDIDSPDYQHIAVTSGASWERPGARKRSAF